MDKELLEKILTLSENRIKFLRTSDGDWFYEWSQTFYDAILDEMREVKIEIDTWKRVLLEDELGDVFWDYICFLEALEREWKIIKEKVYERALEKYSERLNLDGSSRWTWQSIKNQQKQKLIKEQESL